MLTTGNPFACELRIVMSPSFGEGLLRGRYCFTCIRQVGSSGEDVMNSSRICWQGTMCSLTIKFEALIFAVQLLLPRRDRECVGGG